MKKIVLALLFGYGCVTAFSQNSPVLEVHQGFCKKKDVKVITGDTIPKGFVIMQMGTFQRAEVSGNLEGLTKKQINTMKTYAKWRDCCEVFIAFNQIQTFNGYDPGADYYKDKICFYVLAPCWKVEMIE